MKRYILGRLVRAIISVFVVVSIAITMIYTLIPRDKIFSNDKTSLQKLASKPDDLANFKYNKWEQLGYLDYVVQSDMCKGEGIDYAVCMAVESTTETNENGIEITKYVYNDETKKAIAAYEEKGYTIQYFTNGLAYASRDYSSLEIIGNFYKNLFKVDSPWFVDDPNNQDIERKVYFALDYNNMPAIKCVGCEHDYLLYFDSNFPFIHQNWIKLNFGMSYPLFSGRDTLEVINSNQGELKLKEQTYSSGYQGNTPQNLHTCKYKQTTALDHMDKNKFDDNYANCDSYYTDPSMVMTSYIFGIISLILAYAIAIPAGIVMAQKKDKWQDKLGIVYINIMISLPSLAFIYFMKLVGFKLGLPDKFPQYGYGDVRSYILPVIILALMSTAGTMIWVRRYMVDQSNADYVKFARAKGLTQKEIFRKHILKNAIIPIVNGIPSSIILCISGAVITETVFAISGMGKMLPDSIKANNNNMIVTLTFIFTALSVISLLLGDILITFVDPRIQLSSKGETR